MAPENGEAGDVRRFCLPVAAFVLAGALTTLPGRAAVRHSRVIVSDTLNNTLQFFDASTLTETQPPLPSRGVAPVRMTVFGGVLLTANHGVDGTVGIFDLSGDVVTEEPLSPWLARPGSVGIDAGSVLLGGRRQPFVFITNTWQALGGCGLPKGSVTAYRLAGGAGAHSLIEIGTVDVSGPIPYGVAIDSRGARAFVSSNCGNTLDTIAIGSPESLSIRRVATRRTGQGPDGTLFDPRRGRVYVADITGSALSVFDATSRAALTTVPLPRAHPIDIAFTDSTKGKHWIATSNGGDDSVSLVDRDVIERCVVARLRMCAQAEVLRVRTGVSGGAPEGVAYDPVTGRIFAVNKNTAAASLTVIQIREGNSLSGRSIKTIPLGPLGSGVPAPALIAFDVVVQRR
jgi:DNA-binding beta-propeller fold protein YncE